jgi:hypothetical protein
MPNRQGIYSSFKHTLHHLEGMLFIYIKDIFAFIRFIRLGNFGFTVLRYELEPNPVTYISSYSLA